MNTYIQDEITMPDLVISPAKKGKKDHFQQFHGDNPVVYYMLVKLASQFRKKHPTRKISIKMLFEVLRWNYYITTTGGYDYKINNNHAPFYSRMIMTNFPELNGVFDIRSSVADHQ